MARTETDSDQIARFREMWADELAGAALYRGLAEHAGDESKARIYRSLAEAEERHAAHWAAQLRKAGITDLRPPRIPFRVRALRRLARWLGTDAVLPIVLRAEAADAEKYEQVAEAPASMAAQEAAHEKVVAAMRGGDTAGGRIAASEGRHRAGVGGALRASVFGVNDGLVSNFSLVLGMAGADLGSQVVILAGIAGLVSGAFSMAAGEYVSMRVQREVFEGALNLERRELVEEPDAELREVEVILRAQGVPAEDAERIAPRVMEDPELALDLMARQELGLNPDELGSPIGAAASSFASFAVGALLPLLPFVLLPFGTALIAAIVLSGLSLFIVGALAARLSDRPAVFGGGRMLLIGAAAAAVTYGIGKLFGVTMAG